MTTRDLAREAGKALAAPQSGSRDDPNMRDGNSARGNPYESDGETHSTDRDAGDLNAPLALESDEIESEIRPSSEVPPGVLEEAEPFPGYDTWSASMIAAKLGDLTADETRAAAAYEASRRNRKTVLAAMQKRINRGD